MSLSTSNMEVIPDDDDLRLFQPQVGDVSAAKIIRIKHNDPDAINLELKKGGEMYMKVGLDEDASRRLGDILGQNSHVKYLMIQTYVRTIDVTEVCDGLQYNNSIEKIKFVLIDLHNAHVMRRLASFVNHRKLTDLTLNYCNISSESLPILLDALLNNSMDSLRSLSFSDNNFNKVDWNGFVEALSGCRNLQLLAMDYCRIELKGCNALAKLLRRKHSNLNNLYINGNSIDDESAIVLADSLAKNTKLEVLSLDLNRKIKERGWKAGWKAMLRLVCDTSSMDAVVKSNNTLKSLSDFCDDTIPYDHSIVEDCLGIDDARLLKAALEMNGASNKNLVAKRKLIWAHARGDLNLSDSPIPSAAMPDILSWFSNSISDQNDTHLIEYQEPPSRTEVSVDSRRLDSIYRIIQCRPGLLASK